MGLEFEVESGLGPEHTDREEVAMLLQGDRHDVTMGVQVKATIPIPKLSPLGFPWHPHSPADLNPTLITPHPQTESPRGQPALGSGLGLGQC